MRLNEDAIKQRIERRSHAAALQTVVADLAERAGVDPQRLSFVLERRASIFLERQMIQMEDDSPPGVSARFDPRPEDHILEDDEWPSLFE